MNSTMKTDLNMGAGLRITGGLCAILLVTGCGDEGANSRDVNHRDGPLYAVSTTVFAPDSATSYIAVVDSLALGESLDLAESLEIGGGARAYGPEGGDIVYVTSDENATMTEVSFAPDGLPEIGRTVSFAQLGIESTTGGNVHLFVSPTKAYFVSQDILEIVVWNPQSMETIATIPLGLQTDPRTAYVAFYPRSIVVGDALVLVSNEHTEEGLAVGAQVTVVDLARDQIVSTVAEPRCHSMIKSATDTHGDRYFASSTFSAAQHLLTPGAAPAPCMLRMRARETSLDPDWSRTLTAELDTRLWTGVTPSRNGALHMQSIAEDAPAVASAIEAQDAEAIMNAKPWTWHVLTDGETEPDPITTVLATPPVFAPIPVGDDAYVSVWDGADTTLVDLTSSDAPHEGLVVPGFVYNVVRIR